MSTHPPSSNSITPNRKTGHLTVAQTSSNERCPVCDRSFGPKAFDRHVEFCKEQKNRVQVHKSPAVVQQAKERLEARINYRVPPLRQSKRSLVRDKYLPSSQTSVLLRSNSIVQGKSTTSLSTSVTTMGPTRRQVMNNNERCVERNNNKKDATSKTRLDRTIGDCGDTKESIKTETSSTKSFQTKRTIPAKKINKTEVNDSLQGITVSSLNVEKDKKLVTWKDTVKAQPKVTPSISLTTTSTNIKKKVVTNTNEEEIDVLKTPDKVPSLGKVVRSRLLMEKLNMFVTNKKSQEKDMDPTTLFEKIEEKSGNKKSLVKDKFCLTGREFAKDNSTIEDINIEESLNFQDLANISEEGEVEDEFPENSTILNTDKDCKNRVSFAGDCYGDEGLLNITQVIEKSHLAENNTMPKVSNKENLSEECSINSVEDQEDGMNNIYNEGRKNYSDDESKTDEGSSSLCLRLPLEGLESKVKLRNNDLDPDQKLKKNIKSFYEIIKAGKCKVSTKREQLSLLESSKEIKFMEKELLLTSSGSSFFEKNEVDDESEKVCGELVPQISRNDLKTEIIMDEPIETIEKNPKINSTASGLSKKVTFRIASRLSRSWKRRKKLQKCRMCIKCLIRDVRSRKIDAWKNPRSEDQEVGVIELFSSDDEWVFDSPQILGSFENIRKTSDELLQRKSESANCLKTETIEPSSRKIQSCTGKCSLSLPNILLDGNVADVESENCILQVENSFDKVVPRKRRKISPSYLDSGDDANEVEKNLRYNISKIRRRKEVQNPPLILNYEKVGLVSGKSSTADVLYMNEVFTSNCTPERSEEDSVNGCDYDDDGIREYGDEVLEDWDAAEEELFRELERKKNLIQFESPTRLLPRPKVDDFVEVENDDKTEYLDEDLIQVESSNTLKNSSASTIVNMSYEEADLEESKVLPLTQISQEMNMCLPEPEKLEEIATSPRKTEPNLIKMVFDKIPCRLPRIIPHNRQATPLSSSKESGKDDFKLPVIGNLVQAKQSLEVDMLNDKLVQVPSWDAKASIISFCQQTSRILVDNGSSFNRGDFFEDVLEELSPETQMNKSNRRLGTSNVGGSAGLEIRKALREEVRNVSPKEETLDINRTPTAEELYPDNAIMYEEFKKYEEMYRREKEGRSSSSKKQKKTADFGINIDDSGKTYGDSAYGSLNRKQETTEHDSTDQVKEISPVTQSAATTPSERLPKFCHECGNKYPVPSAKFCVECGVRRLIL